MILLGWSYDIVRMVVADVAVLYIHTLTMQTLWFRAVLISVNYNVYKTHFLPCVEGIIWLLTTGVLSELHWLPVHSALDLHVRILTTRQTAYVHYYVTSRAL